MVGTLQVVDTGLDTSSCFFNSTAISYHYILNTSTYHYSYSDPYTNYTYHYNYPYSWNQTTYETYRDKVVDYQAYVDATDPTGHGSKLAGGEAGRLAVGGCR